MLNLDTHILIAAVDGSLREPERRLLGSDFWCISDVVLWELGHLARAGRTRMPLSSRDLAGVLSQLTVWPITIEIAHSLARLDFRSDPADEIIAATSLVHDIPLITRDTRILASKVVPLARV